MKGAVLIVVEKGMIFFFQWKKHINISYESIVLELVGGVSMAPTNLLTFSRAGKAGKHEIVPALYNIEKSILSLVIF